MKSQNYCQIRKKKACGSWPVLLSSGGLCSSLPWQEKKKYVPGTNEDFSVAGYKKELSKPYSKLDLFLCKTHEYTQHIAEAEGNEDMAMESFKAG